MPGPASSTTVRTSSEAYSDMTGLLFTYIVTACAMVTASAAVAAAGYLRAVKTRWMGG